jgi:hypothetical protein
LSTGANAQRTAPLKKTTAPSLTLSNSASLGAGKFKIDKKYTDGPVDGTLKDLSLAQKSKPSDDDKIVLKTGKAVVVAARKLLPSGPFNNRAALPEKIAKREPYPAYANALVDEITAIAVRRLKRKNKEASEFTLTIACKAEAVKRVGGGVCSQIATLCTSLLSTLAPKGAEICQVFINKETNHEFVIMKYGNSRWFVIDPWPLVSLVVPFADCAFTANTVATHFRMTVIEPAPEDKPLGVDLSVLDWKSIELKARKILGPPNASMSKMSSNFEQDSNAGTPECANEQFIAADIEDWGPGKYS